MNAKQIIREAVELLRRQTGRRMMVEETLGAHGATIWVKEGNETSQREMLYGRFGADQGFPFAIDFREGRKEYKDQAELVAFLNDNWLPRWSNGQSIRIDLTWHPGDLVFVSVPGDFDSKGTILQAGAVGQFLVRMDFGPRKGNVYSVKREYLSPRTGDEPETLHDRGLTPHGVALEDSKPIPGTNPVQYEPMKIALDPRLLTDAPYDLLTVANSQKMAIQTSRPVSRITPMGEVEFNWAKLDLEELRRHRDELNTIIYDKERGK